MPAMLPTAVNAVATASDSRGYRHCELIHAVSSPTNPGGLFISTPYLFFWAEPGYQYFVVYPNGKKDAVMSEGIKFRGFAQITPWQKFIDVKVTSNGEDTDDIEGQMEPIPIRFIDQVTATARLSTRFQCSPR